MAHFLKSTTFKTKNINKTFVSCCVVVKEDLCMCAIQPFKNGNYFCEEDETLRLVLRSSCLSLVPPQMQPGNGLA